MDNPGDVAGSSREFEYNRLIALAAEKAVTDLKAEAKAGREAAIAIRKAARIRLAWNVLLSIVVAATSYLGFQLHSQAVSSCQASNARAHGTVVALNQLVTLLEGTHPTAAVKSEAAQYEAFVAVNNSPRDCTQAFSIWP